MKFDNLIRQYEVCLEHYKNNPKKTKEIKDKIDKLKKSKKW